MQHSTWHSETWHLATRGPRKCVEVPQFCTQRKHEKKVYRVSKCNKYSHILEYMSVTITARYSSKIRTKTSSVAYACSCWIPKATNIHYSLLFHCNNGCTNAPQCYVIPTLSNLFFFLFFRLYSVFLLIFFRLESFLHLVSDCRDEEMATVLCMKQYTVKTCVR